MNKNYIHLTIMMYYNYNQNSEPFSHINGQLFRNIEFRKNTYRIW
jgi:hypothetical protein